MILLCKIGLHDWQMLALAADQCVNKPWEQIARDLDKVSRRICTRCGKVVGLPHKDSLIYLPRAQAAQAKFILDSLFHP